MLQYIISLLVIAIMCHQCQMFLMTRLKLKIKREQVFELVIIKLYFKIKI